jgi:hypothetical protein
MKQRAIWMMVPAVALGLGACNKKQEVKAPDAPAPVAAAAQTETPAPPPAPAVKTASLSAEERAAKLGFVKHLPQDTEVVMAFHNGSKSADRIKSSKIWKLVESEMGMGMMGGGEDFEPAGEEMEEDLPPLPEAEQAADAEPGDAPEMPEPMGPAALFGTEFTVALGKSAGEQTGNLLTLNRRMSYFQMRMLAKALVASAKSGDFSSLQETMANQYGPELLKDLIADPESGTALFEKMKMPPLYFAFRTSASDRESAAQQLASLTENIAMLGETVEPIEVEKAGQKFAGQMVSGAKISAAMSEDREEMDEMLDPAVVDKIIASVAKKDLVVLSGTLGDYAVLFIGSSTDDMNFAADTASSMVAADTLAFADPYASKDLAAVIYGQEKALDTLMATAGGLSDMAAGLRDGLAGSEGLGDTRDLEALLRMVGERETALRKLAGNEALGMVAFFEDGLKIESHGGTDNGAVDWKSPNKLASLGDSEDVVMFANMTSDAAYNEKMRDYLEALMETVYAVSMKVTELPMEDENMAQFKDMAKTFDTKFRPDLVEMWDAFSGGFGGSLGNESALIVDLSGTMPAIPGVPQPVVDEAKFPRISMIAPVTDRAKLAASWQKMNTTTTNILAKISEMTGEDIPMQKPISSDKDGFTTWFFSMPFFNDDFMPSVTVGDKWFAASTSKNQALDLVNKADKGGETRNGLWFTVNFNALRKFSTETVKMLDKNKDDLGIDADDLKNATKIIEAMEDMDKLTVHARREGGALRSSVHFKTH